MCKGGKRLVAIPSCFVFGFASLHVGRGIDMGSRQDDFLM